MEMNKKYELTNETIVYGGRTLYRIKALRNFGDVEKGELGGWIEGEYNLSQEDMCWIYNEAKAVDNSMVCDNARMHDNTVIYDNARLRDDAEMYDNAKMYDDTIAFGNAAMFDNAKMYGNSIIGGNARMNDNAIMCSYSEMTDNSSMHDHSIMYGRTKMSGDAEIRYEGELRNAAELGGNDKLYGKLYCRVDNFIEIFVPKGGLVTGVLVNGEIFYNVDKKEQITKEEFIERTKGNKEYLKVINMIEMYLS